MNQSLVLTFQNEWEVTFIRVQARNLAEQLGFSKNDQYKIDLCLMELTSNVLNYAGKGIIDLEVIGADNSIGLKITCCDQGPGIEDCTLALTNGWSSSGSLGLGLPSVRRLADEFEIDSGHDKGTTIIIKKWVG